MLFVVAPLLQGLGSVASRWKYNSGKDAMACASGSREVQYLLLWFRVRVLLGLCDSDAADWYFCSGVLVV